ncbi:MAG: hypothetical protein AABY18_09115 [Candidatus Thermoplasmatota archaeon]
MSESNAASQAGGVTSLPTPPRSLHSILPSLAGLAGCILLAIINQARGFDLWRNYALTGLVEGSIIAWILWRWNARIPHYIQWVITAAAMLHYGGGSLGSTDPYHMGLFGFHGINGAYHTFDWWDHLTHGVGVGAATMAAAYLLEAYQMRRGLQWRARTVWFLAVLVGLALGVGVELAEYLGKSAFNTIDQGGYDNTMQDLHYNVLGAALGAAIAAIVDRRRLTRRIEGLIGKPRPIPPPTKLLERIPPAMAGLTTFVSAPAAMTFALSLRYLFQDHPVLDPRAYDDALNLMLASTIAGAVLGPVVALVWPKRAPTVDAASP